MVMHVHVAAVSQSGDYHSDKLVQNTCTGQARLQVAPIPGVGDGLHQSCSHKGYKSVDQLAYNLIHVYARKGGVSQLISV